MTPPLVPSDPSNSQSQSGISRRSFLALTAMLASCRAAPPLGHEGSPIVRRRPVQGAAPIAHETLPPVQKGPVPRNPDASLSSDFSHSANITFTRVKAPGKWIAITFDDGPHPQNTPRLLEMLRARNIKATFFVVGRNVDLYPHVVRQTVAEGHEIGNHTYTHRLLSKLSDSEVRTELIRCRDAVSRASGFPIRVLRPPYGGLLPRQREWVHAEFGYPTILWSVDPLDWKRPGPSVVSSRILKGTSAGGIVLSHDLHAQTVDAMPATLDELLRRGFQFATVSQLLAMESVAVQTPVSAPTTL